MSKWHHKFRSFKRNRKNKRMITKHHLIPKSRGGHNDKQNLLNLWSDKHHLFHELFGNMTLSEIIILLQRIESAKKNQGS